MHGVNGGTLIERVTVCSNSVFIQLNSCIRRQVCTEPNLSANASDFIEPYKNSKNACYDRRLAVLYNPFFKFHLLLWSILCSKPLPNTTIFRRKAFWYFNLHNSSLVVHYSLPHCFSSVLCQGVQCVFGLTTRLCPFTPAPTRQPPPILQTPPTGLFICMCILI